MLKTISEKCSRGFFNYIHRNNLVYNTCWEDPRIDRKALNLGPKDTVVVITSAGCNVLDYVLDEPAHIYSVDVNPIQNALLDLKIAAIRELDYETFFSIFGNGCLEAFPTLYKNRLRPLLSASSKAHWDKHKDYFTGSFFRPTFYFRGTSGLFARLLNSYIELRGVRDWILSMFAVSSVKEQKEIYFKYLNPVFWGQFVKWVVRQDSILSLLGVPRTQREQIENDYQGGLARFVQDCVESVFTRLSLKDNYFWWLYLNGAYSKGRCPEYLKKRNFNKLRANVDRISIHTNTISGFLRESESKVSHFVLLDHMDWLSQNHKEVLADEWQAIVDRATEESRILWRSGALCVDFVDPISVRLGKTSVRLEELLRYQTDLAERLHRIDRVHTYGSFYVADLAVN